jgi:thiol:disulfide interchange protein DsbC
MVAVLVLQHNIVSAQQIDYAKIVSNFISAITSTGVPLDVSFEGREVFDTESPDWKAVVTYIKRGGMKQPMPFFVSKDGKSVVPGSMVFVNNKPIFTKQLQPKLEKIDFKFSTENRIVYNPNGQKLVFMFFDPDCPYCQQVEEKLKTYAGNYRIVLKHFPLPHHHDAKEKSIAMQVDWMKSKGIGLNENAIQKEAQRIVDEDISEATKAEIMGTPFFIDEGGNIIDMRKEIGLVNHPTPKGGGL